MDEITKMDESHGIIKHKNDDVEEEQQDDEPYDDSILLVQSTTKNKSHPTNKQAAKKEEIPTVSRILPHDFYTNVSRSVFIMSSASYCNLCGMYGMLLTWPCFVFLAY